MNERHYSPLDRLIMNLDQAVTTVLGHSVSANRENPASQQETPDLTETERQLCERLMRINHAGEVAAQALYQGQSMTADLGSVRAAMEKASAEENDHLTWCTQRINELSGHTSYLNPFWYAGSFAIGALAGLAGDQWSLGFVAETEQQVVRHLDKHLQQLPQADHKSRAILEQMRSDEEQHATVALESGGKPLPEGVRKLMALASSIMTRTAYWV